MSADGGKRFLYVRIVIADQSCFSHNSADSNFNNVFFIFSLPLLGLHKSRRVSGV
ncbi:hypothetical protein HJ49_004919 [Salmonella enterica subsp. enterica]|nr:hypothetical protein [Salmonella enterica]EDW0018455.1 hypothetical protein [Salmonella enterica subsp. enterica serovar Aba]EHB3808443.1 hypothetical protein [Salmonella enterica subsp. enterica serovar Bonariensis]EHQ1843648.1 hypothetical protein [Salmonella enterica subsp. enterica serovar Saintpaul]EIH3064797.1 hypothetical protein [Salmonella enterica subsp. enterica serovar Sandiego]HCZ4730859.1 hypothetical protein [Salmonella enterica subsp. enterica serovar Saintpaul str. CFSAN004